MRSRPGRRVKEGEAHRAPCFDKAVQLLGVRTHFRAELADKLRRRGYEGEEVEAALARLGTLGYLDDSRAAGEYVRLQRERRGWGRARLAAELGRRGAAREVIAEALAEIGDEADLGLARAEVERSRARGEDPARAARRLARKGLPARAILAALGEAGGPDLDD